MLEALHEKKWNYILLTHWDFIGLSVTNASVISDTELISEVVYYSISFYIYKHKIHNISVCKHITTLGCHEFLLMTKNNG